MESAIKEKVEFDRKMFQQRQRGPEQPPYQHDQTHGDPEQDSYAMHHGDQSRDLQPQIYYKKDNSRVMYEEGQETYRGPAQF